MIQAYYVCNIALRLRWSACRWHQRAYGLSD